MPNPQFAPESPVGRLLSEGYDLVLSHGHLTVSRVPSHRPGRRSAHGRPAHPPRQ